MQLKYSVVIPIYNAGNTLKRCVDSILVQDCSDVEIILVNDGSKDGSGEICEEYAGKHPNVHYISQQNAGVSAARNAGLDIAQGEFILFVDSDDYVADRLLSLLPEMLASHPADLLQFSYASVKGGQITEHRLTPHDYSGEEMEKTLQQAICDKSLNAPWAKVYRRNLIEEHHIRFPLGISIAEDRLFNMEYALYAQSYTTLDTVGYYLSLENEQSLSRRKNDMATQNRLYNVAFDAMISRSNASSERKEMICRAVNFGTCRSVYAEAKSMHCQHMRFTDRICAIHAWCRNYNNKKLKLPDTRYCRLVSLPIRWNLPLVIDVMAATLVRRAKN